MPDIDNFAKLLHQLFDSHLGVVHNDRDAHHVGQFTASDRKRLHVRATTAQETYDTVEHTVAIIGKEDQDVRASAVLGSIFLARSPGGSSMSSHDGFFPPHDLQSFW